MISTIVILTLTFAILGLLLGISASYDPEYQLPADIEKRDQEVQSILFDKCITKAESNDELTEEEYFQCAYSIYD